MVKKTIILFCALSIAFLNAQVGIGVETPTETLDIDGNIRVRSLNNGINASEYTRVIMVNSEGVLGYSEDLKIIPKYVKLIYVKNEAGGLIFNTNDRVSGPSGVQFYKPEAPDMRFLLFGKKNTGYIDATDGRFTDENVFFDAEENDLLKVSSLITFSVSKNGPGGLLSSISPNGDRQVILELFLYKGSELKEKTKKVINFNGRNGQGSDTYKNDFTENIQLAYLVPQGETGEYNVAVVIYAKAPEDGNFRVSFQEDGSQIQELLISKY